MEVMVVDEEEKSKAAEACRWLRETKLRELLKDKRRLVEVPYTATLSHTINVLLANDVVAVPVAAPPGRWIGAGGSMILESDPITGALRKHYIGMVTMLDILVHIAEEEGGVECPSSPTSSPRKRAGVAFDGDHRGAVVSELQRRMEVPVSSVIGHSLEGLSLWTLNPNTSILDCMEAFSKGVHRALVPFESRATNIVAVELSEASPGYQMITQMDVLKFLRANHQKLKEVLSVSVEELGAIKRSVFSITKQTKVLEALKSMRTASLSSVPIVDTGEHLGDSHELMEREGRKLLGTFSATDLRSCPMDELQTWLAMSVVEFKAKISKRPSFSRTAPGGDIAGSRGKLITCHPETKLAQVMEDVVIAHVHKVWVLDGDGYLVGLISLTDMLGVIRAALLSSAESNL